VSASVDAARALWLLALYRLFVALFLLWLGTLGSSDPGFLPTAPRLFILATAGYVLLALLLTGLAWHWAKTIHAFREAQIVGGTLGDIVAISLILLTAGGVETGLGLLLLPAVAAAATMTSGRISLFMAALATVVLLSSELLIGPSLPWAFTPAPTQTGLLGATLFVAAILAWRLARRVGVSEAQVARQEVDLANLAELNTQIIARMGAGIIAVDRDGRICSINETARRLLPPRAGNRLRDLSPHLAQALISWQQDIGSGATHQLAGGPEQVELQVRLAPLGVAGDQGTLLILEDAAEIKRKAHAGKLQSLGRLTASIAHEIRNPVGAISHSAQLLAESSKLDAGDQRLLEIIQQQSLRVDRVIHNVLNLSRGPTAAREIFPLEEWLTRFAEDFCTGLHLPPEALHIRIHPRGSRAIFDPSQLHQVLWNLCSNAHLHGGHDAPDSGPIILRGGAGQIHRGTSLDVIDSGPGVLAAQQADLFEPFSSTTPTGTGLGLYISRLLCENNGAALEYVTQPQGGCFRILFAPLEGFDTPTAR